MMLELFPLGGSLDGDLDVAVNPDVIREAQKKRPTGKRLFKDLRRKETAAQAVAELERDGMEIFGLTRGQFSLSDMIEAILQKIGPARMSISTWTAAQVDISRMMELLRGGMLTDCRWLVDLSFIRRTPELCNQIREQFGLEAVRVMRTHAKFVLLENDEWRIALRSSMNLNQNPRLESYQVGHDPELCDWLGQVLDDVWRRQPRELAAGGNIAAMGAWWQEESGRETFYDEAPPTLNAPPTMSAIVTVGVPGSGKTHWARETAEKTGAAVIELDAARKEINGDEADLGNANKVRALRDRWLKEAAARGQDVIISDTNLNPHFRAQTIKQLEALGYVVEIRVFDEAPYVCRRRNAERARVVPDDIMDRMIEEFWSQRASLSDGAPGAKWKDDEHGDG